MPRIFPAQSRTSSMDFASFTPPPLPRPPAWICAFTTHTLPPSFLAALTASSTLKQGVPQGVGTPYFLRISFAWYSWIFIAGLCLNRTRGGLARRIPACMRRAPEKKPRDRQLEGRRKSRPAGKRGKYTAKARAADATRQRSETGREPRHQRPVRGQLHAIHILVNRHLNETIELRVAAKLIAESRTDEGKVPTAVLRFGLRAAVAVAIEQIQLQ